MTLRILSFRNKYNTFCVAGLPSDPSFHSGKMWQIVVHRHALLRFIQLRATAFVSSNLLSNILLTVISNF